MQAYKMALPENLEERQEMSRRVQEHAFKTGREWLSGSKKIIDLDENDLFFYFNESGQFTTGASREYFRISDREEITPEAFLALPVPRDFMTDFKKGLYVVGVFMDTPDEKFPTLGILEYIKTEQQRGGEEKKQYCTSVNIYQIFSPVESFYSKNNADNFIKKKLGMEDGE